MSLYCSCAKKKKKKYFLATCKGNHNLGKSLVSCSRLVVFSYTWLEKSLRTLEIPPNQQRVLLNNLLVFIFQSDRCFALWIKCNGNAWEAQTEGRLQLLQSTPSIKVQAVRKYEMTTFTLEKLDQSVKITTWSFQCCFNAFLSEHWHWWCISLQYTCTSTPWHYGGVLTHLQTTDTYIHKVQQVPQLVYTVL